MVRETTTSQPSNRSAARAPASPKVAATLLPAAGNRRHGLVPGARGGLGHIDHRRQHVIVDVNQVSGVFALVAALGDDHGQRLADEPDHVRGEQRLAHVGVDHAGHRRCHHREVGQVSAGERGDDAGRLERGADVDRTDPRVRDRRPDEMHMAGAGKPHVVGVDPAGRQEAGIFGPDDPGTQNAHSHDLAWPGGDGQNRPGGPRDGGRRAQGRKIGYPFCVGDGGVAQSGRASGS